MIQAGTISTGSACTVVVVGVYWISSISSLRNTTLPGVTASVLPTSKSSVPAGAAPLSVRPQVLDHVLEPAHQVLPLLGLGQRQQLGVGRQVVRRRAGVEQHAHRELQQLGVVVGDAADVAHRLVHQRRVVLVGARVDVERKLRSSRRALEAPVGLAFQAFGRRHRLPGQRAQRKRPGVLRALQRLLLQLLLLGRRQRQVHRPVGPGGGEGGRGEAGGHLRHLGAELAIEVLGRWGPLRLVAMVLVMAAPSAAASAAVSHAGSGRAAALRPARASRRRPRARR